MHVCIPYAEDLAESFPGDRVRSRRDFPKLLALIETSAYLHQQRRQTQDHAVIATPDDYLVAKRLFENSYATGPDSRLTELLEAAQQLKDKANFRASDLIEATGWGKSKTYAVLERAEELGCIAETETRGVYSFVRNSVVPPLALPERV